ncbi:ATPase, T2SS/T4P/T4SS family [Paenibacillus alvei]|uniref:ATPase, T2SS/T4P/T4SS family n=1 Tax=Paenibacillus alvei TaxID=44250 RepID=UPI00227DEC25|nr:ATPase, T2SS/T4P/T4SS family [Paenibacillus alvei]
MIEDMIREGNISQEVSEFLGFVVSSGVNIVISGLSGSGKVTQLMGLVQYTDPKIRILSYENSREQQEKQSTNTLNNFIAISTKDNQGMQIGDLVESPLLSKASIFIIGEVTNEEIAKKALHAMNIGHTVWTTIHEDSAVKAVKRIWNLNGGIRPGTGFELILHLQKLESGNRVITEISEITGYSNQNEPMLNTIFKYDFQEQKHVRVGSITSESLLKCFETLEMDRDVIKRWCHSKLSKEVMLS